jgi:hypothetical protein
MSEINPFHTFIDNFKYNRESFQMYYALLRLYKYCPCVCFEYIEQLPYLEASKLKALLDLIEFKSKQKTSSETKSSTPDEVSFGIATTGSGVGGNDMLSIGGRKLHVGSVTHISQMTAAQAVDHEEVVVETRSETHKSQMEVAPAVEANPFPESEENPTRDGHNGLPSVAQPNHGGITPHGELNVAKLFNLGPTQTSGMISPPQEHVFVIMYLFEVAGIIFSNHSSTLATRKDYINRIKLRVKDLPHATPQLIKVLEDSGLSDAVLDMTACMNIAYMLLQFIKQL